MRDAELTWLYGERRKAAAAANASGWKGIKGWAKLEAIEAKLGERDPDGDWRYESNDYDGRGWVVRRTS